MGRMRRHRQLLVLTVLSMQAETSRGSSPSWQDSGSSSSNRPRPDASTASGYPFEFRGQTPRKDHEADRHSGYGDGSRERADRSGSTDGYGYAQDTSRPKEPPPPESDSSYTPIHYQFRAIDEKAPSTRNGNNGHDVPRTEQDGPQLFPKDAGLEDDRTFASPRDDIITRYMSNKRKRIMLTLSSGMVGMTIGSFVGKVRTCIVLTGDFLFSLFSHLLCVCNFFSLKKVLDEQSKACW
jgi:hypothetical protein